MGRVFLGEVSMRAPPGHRGELNLCEVLLDPSILCLGEVVVVVSSCGGGRGVKRVQKPAVCTRLVGEGEGVDVHEWSVL